MDEHQIKKISALIKERLLAGESVPLEGIGTFSRIHEPQYFSRDEKGERLLILLKILYSLALKN